jgi:hypothetical protein
MSAAENRAGDRRHRADEIAAGRVAHPPLSADARGPAARHAPHPARVLAHGGDIIDIHRLGRIDKPAPIVALLDISGSMSEYTGCSCISFMPSPSARKRVSVFPVRHPLTNVTRALRARDPD